MYPMQILEIRRETIFGQIFGNVWRRPVPAQRYELRKEDSSMDEIKSINLSEIIQFKMDNNNNLSNSVGRNNDKLLIILG